MIEKLIIPPIPLENYIVKKAISDNQLVTGPHIVKFEESLASKFGFKYSVTVTNGSAAILLTINALGLKKKKIVVPNVSTCHAIINAVLSSGNEPLFCPLDQDTFGLHEATLDSIVSTHNVALIIAPSHFGIPVSKSLFKRFKIPVIEDACQAFFSRLSVKSSAEMMLLSFYPTKQFNCIEGGAVLTNNLNLVEELRDLRYYDHQTNFDRKQRYNFRMPNLNAAIGLARMELVDDVCVNLQEVKLRYIEGIENQCLLNRSFSEKGVVPWRFMISNLNDDQRQGLQNEGVVVSTELAWVGDGGISQDIHSFVNRYYSIPFYEFFPAHKQQIIIDTINKWS